VTGRTTVIPGLTLPGSGGWGWVYPKAGKPQDQPLGPRSMTPIRLDPTASPGPEVPISTVPTPRKTRTIRCCHHFGITENP
jgi:hypothetical protein